MNIKELVATFENGDKLVLTLKESTFAGYNSRKLWELFYAECLRAGDTLVYTACHTEYFPENAVSQAVQAFNTRRTSNNPVNESDQGFELSKIL